MGLAKARPNYQRLLSVFFLAPPKYAGTRPYFWCWFDTTQFSYHYVQRIHAKMFSIQMLLYFSQIVWRVCTLMLFIMIAFGTEFDLVFFSLSHFTVSLCFLTKVKSCISAIAKQLYSRKMHPLTKHSQMVK